MPDLYLTRAVAFLLASPHQPPHHSAAELTIFDWSVIPFWRLICCNYSQRAHKLRAYSLSTVTNAIGDNWVDRHGNDRRVVRTCTHNSLIYIIDSSRRQCSRPWTMSNAGKLAADWSEEENSKEMRRERTKKTDDFVRDFIQDISRTSIACQFKWNTQSLRPFWQFSDEAVNWLPMSLSCLKSA